MNNFRRRQSKIIAISIAVTGALTLAIVTHIDALYTATTLIVVDTRAGQITAAPGNTAVFQLANSLVDNELEILRSHETMRRAIGDLGAPTDRQANPTTLLNGLVSLISSTAARSPTRQNSETRTIIDLSEHTVIERLGRSFTIAINVSDPSPERAATLANALADGHLAERRETGLATARAAETAIATRVADLAVNLRSIEGRVDDMLLAAAAANLARHEGVTAAQNSAVRDVLERLASRRRMLFAERAELTLLLQAEPKTADNPQESDEDLQARRTQIDEQLAALETTTANVRQQLQGFLNTDDLGPSLTLTVQRLQGEAQATRQVYQDALERWRQVQLLTSRHGSEVRILSRAVPPLRSDQPTKLYVGLAGLMIGLGVGIGIGLVREQVLLGVFDADMIERATQLSIIALLPTVSRFDANAPQDLVVTQPASRFTEGVRRIVRTLDTTVGLERPDEGALCVLMTSSNANEGKSTLALSYAMHEATVGKSTLLIDADLRQSALYDRLNWQIDATETQFSDVLAGQGTLADITGLTFRDPETGMNVLGNAKPPLGSVEKLLASTRFADLISAARCKYDVIVIDSAPAAHAVDTRILLGYVDVAVMAIRHGRTTLPNIQKTLRQLDQHRAPPIFGALTFVEQAGANV
ncbi:MAG: GNVR domain-containing protein [Pseudomonadota bacterium]